MTMRTRTTFFPLTESKQWSCELGLGLGFSLGAARVHTHHIYTFTQQGLTALLLKNKKPMDCGSQLTEQLHKHDVL